ncbi:unnamed protein product [Calypogeia fissa]
MILSKVRSLASSHGNRAKIAQAKEKTPTELEDFLEIRDYTGAIALLQFKFTEAKGEDVKAKEWLAYCHFHHGEHDKALKLYNELLETSDGDPMYHVYSAACLFYIGLYQDAEQAALKGPECPLQTRILFHVAHWNNDESKLMMYHNKLGDCAEDRLSLASIHYLRGHYQEATDVYKELLAENRDWLALNVYVALCYYHMDYHDVSLEILNNYLEVHPDSALAVNVKACNNFKLSNVKAAESSIKSLESAYGGPVENNLVHHNQVVFQNRDGALQVFLSLADVLPEAQLNLVVYYLQHGQAQQAYNTIKSLEPTSPQEFILKAVTLATYGQQLDLEDLIKHAQRLYQVVGTSASECDTILGRQCMASCFFLLKQFDDALIYLKSIKPYCEGQEDFLWNYAIAKAANHEYQEAQETLLKIENDCYQNDYLYKAWLAHCFIANGAACLAWDQYLRVKATEESFSLLLLIANESYKTSQFLFAAKAFDVLEKMDASPEHWEGKRGACVGVFQQVIVGKESKQSLKDVMTLLQTTSHLEAEHILRIIQKWAKENNFLSF